MPQHLQSQSVHCDMASTSIRCAGACTDFIIWYNTEVFMDAPQLPTCKQDTRAPVVTDVCLLLRLVQSCVSFKILSSY